MYKYKKIYDMALYEGMKDACEDYIKSKRKKFKKINDNLIKSKIYDKGYIKGYNMFFDVVKKKSI